MSRLYEITGDILTLQELLESDTDDQCLQDTLEAVQGEYEFKIEAYCKVIRNLESQRDAHKVEADRHNDISKSLDKNIERLKKAMFDSMKATNTAKVKGQLFTVSIQKNGGKTPVDYDKDNKNITLNLPDEYVVVTEKPNLDVIRAALESGVKVDGFTLGERGESLRIK